MNGFKPIGSVPFSPAFLAPFPERRAAYIDWDSPSVLEDIYGKPKVSFKQSLKKKLQKLRPITRPLLSPFVVSSSNPYPPETDAPVVRAVKAIARLGRPPKKFEIKLSGGRRHLPPPTPSPLVRNPTSIVPEGCYTLVEKNGYFVEKRERRFSGKKIKARVCRRASSESS